MNRRLGIGVLCVAGIIAALVVAVFLPSGGSKSPAVDDLATSNPGSEDKLVARPSDRPQGNAKAPAAPGPSKPVPSATPKLDRQQAIERIKKRMLDLDKTRTQSGTYVVSRDNNPVGERTMEFFKKAFMEMRPLLRGCYQRALAADPKLTGYARANISILADDEYGGLVETSDVVGNEQIQASEALVECLRETLYELRFDAERTHGRMVVSMPLVFASSDGPPPNVPDEAKQMRITLEDWLVE